MSEILVNTIKKADGTGSITVPSETGTVLTSASDIPAANLTGSLPAIDGSALTGVGSTDYGAVGTYVLALSTGNTEPGDTVAGSTLYRDPQTNYAAINGNGGSSAGWCYTNGVTNLGLSGTWRSVTRSRVGTLTSYYFMNLWVRIS